MGKRIQRKTERNGVLMEQLNSAKFSLSPRSNNAKERERERVGFNFHHQPSLSRCVRECVRERERERGVNVRKSPQGKKYIYDAASTSLKFSVNNNCVCELWGKEEREGEG